MDSGAWQAIIHGVTKNGTQLSPHAHRYTLYTYALYIHMYFPDGSGGKESACNVGDPGSILGLGRSPRGGHGNPL